MTRAVQSHSPIHSVLNGALSTAVCEHPRCVSGRTSGSWVVAVCSDSALCQEVGPPHKNDWTQVPFLRDDDFF